MFDKENQKEVVELLNYCLEKRLEQLENSPDKEYAALMERHEKLYKTLRESITEELQEVLRDYCDACCRLSALLETKYYIYGFKDALRLRKKLEQ